MTNPLRVAMIINGYHPRVGGAERQVGALAPLLQKQGVKVHILTRRYDRFSPFERVDGVPVHRLPIPRPKPLASLFFTLSGLLLLHKLRPDVIHAHDMYSCTTTAVAMKRLSKTPVVVTPHGGGSEGDIERLKRKTMGGWRINSFRNEVDAFTTISEEIDQGLAGIGIAPEKRIAIPNGVDTERFAPFILTKPNQSLLNAYRITEPQPILNPMSASVSANLNVHHTTNGHALTDKTQSKMEKRAIRALHNLPEEGLITIFTGRLVPGKRVDQLLAVWPTVRTYQPNAHLLILGTGPEEKALKQGAGEGVHFTGNVDDVAPYLKAADLFVLPSAAEGLSVALLEAMASGLPAISTTVGGAPDLINHGQNGWLIPPDNLPALQSALIELLGNSTQREKIGNQARKRVVRDYSLPAVAGQLHELYKKLAGR